jgi:hypothetical protein
MTTIKTDFGSGGANLNPGGSGGVPDLATTLRDIADDLAAVSGGDPDWTTGITVTTHVATLAEPGWVLAVEATTATSAGPKQQIQSGSPAAGEVDVAYTAGVATLTFNATDAVTACAVTYVARGAAYAIKTIKG